MTVRSLEPRRRWLSKCEASLLIPVMCTTGVLQMRKKPTANVTSSDFCFQSRVDSSHEPSHQGRFQKLEEERSASVKLLNSRIEGPLGQDLGRKAGRSEASRPGTSAWSPRNEQVLLRPEAWRCFVTRQQQIKQNRTERCGDKPWSLPEKAGRHARKKTKEASSVSRRLGSRRPAT